MNKIQRKNKLFFKEQKRNKERNIKTIVSFDVYVQEKLKKDGYLDYITGKDLDKLIQENYQKEHSEGLTEEELKFLTNFIKKTYIESHILYYISSKDYETPIFSRVIDAIVKGQFNGQQVVTDTEYKLFVNKLKREQVFIILDENYGKSDIINRLTERIKNNV